MSGEELRDAIVPEKQKELGGKNLYGEGMKLALF
jgi:hypothetical protein